MNNRIDNFIIREADGTSRFANSLVLGPGTVQDSVSGLPELNGTRFVGARVWPDLPIPLHNLAEVTIAHGEIDFDSGGFFNTDEPTRLTVPPGRGGVYQVVARGVFTAGPVGMRVTGFRLNGALLGISRQVASGPSIAVIATEMVHLRAGDYLEMGMYQDSGTTLDAVGIRGYETAFMMARLGV